MTPSDMRQFADNADFVRDYAMRLLEQAETLRLNHAAGLLAAVIALIEEAQKDACLILGMNAIREKRQR